PVAGCRPCALRGQARWAEPDPLCDGRGASRHRLAPGRDRVRSRLMSDTKPSTVETPPTLPGFADVQLAASRLAGVAHRTPVLRSATADAITGARLFFKCENLQRMGAFKFRGAYNAIAALDDD